jgi:3-oxoacyl-[acyl-carrier-protein] synthase-3
MNIAHSRIVSTGSYLPRRELSNTELTQFSASRISLIKEKTGIDSRRHVEKDEATSDLALQAAQCCLERGRFPASDLEAIILATSTPDRIMPASATTVQAKLGAVNAFAFDINSVCSGGIYALDLADAMIKSGKCKNVLVIASDVYSKILNPKDFATYPYFGDGAGAVLVERGEHEQRGLICSVLHSDGNGSEVIHVPAGGSRMPGWCVETKDKFYFRMSGRRVYEFAAREGSRVIVECIEKAGYVRDDIGCVIAHQANLNVLKDIAKNAGIAFDRFFVNLQRYGNTAGASVIIALDEAIRLGKVSKGDLIVLVAFGGGLSWGAILARL